MKPGLYAAVGITGAVVMIAGFNLARNDGSYWPLFFLGLLILVAMVIIGMKPGDGRRGGDGGGGCGGSGGGGCGGGGCGGGDG